MDSKSTTKLFPGFDRIFCLGGTGSNRAFRGNINLKSDETFALTRAEKQPDHPVRAEWAMGSAKPGDVVWTTMGVVTIVSDAVVQMLRSHGFTGWSLYDITVWDKQGQCVPGYSGLAITGRCGKIDYTRTIEVPRIYPAGIFPVGKGLLFEPASWDGSDLFMPAERSGFVFLVEEVKKAFERAKIKNVSFERLDQFEVDWLNVK